MNHADVRTCCRCGVEIEASSIVCQNCRKPRNSNGLSFRQKQICDFITQGMPNKEIAARLHLSEGTIKEYLNRLFRKLGVSNRTELAVKILTERQI